MYRRAKDDEFVNIIKLHKKLIFKVCNSYCKNFEDRKDLVQEVIIRLWQSFEKYNDKYKLSTWIYRIALNTSISHYRYNRRRKENIIPMHESLLEIAEGNDEEKLDGPIKQLHEIVNKMNEMNRALMILYLDNNSYKDIADILGISETNVATKISRIKIQLKQNFEKLKN